MSLAILFYFLCTQHVSDINISIIRSLRLCFWITTSVVLFCKDEGFSVGVNLCCLVFTEQNYWCGNSTTHSQASDDGNIIVRNMLRT